MTGEARHGVLRGWRLWALSLVVPVAFFAVGVHTLNDFGETWDEQFDQDIGRFYVNDWAKTGVAGLEQRFIPLQRYYGPFFDVVVVAAAHLLHDRLGVVTNPVAAYHVPVLVVSSLGLWLIFWFGRRLWGTAEGLTASAVLAIMPQFIAHSQNNLKDMPLAIFFTLSLFLLVEAVRRRSLAWFAVAGVAAGLTFAIKLHALFLAPIVLLWQAPELRADLRRWGRLLAGLTVSGATAIATTLAVWPYFRYAPVLRFVELLRTFGDHEYNEYVFYLGHHFRAHDVPWHFPFVMLGVNTPLVDVVLVIAALAALVVITARGLPGRSPLLLVAIWLLVPPVVQSVSGAIMLDGVRHYLPVLPALALLVAYGACAAVSRLAAAGPRGRWLAWGGAGALAACFAAVLREDVRLHPYEVVYFNAIAGGTAGARARFELDYWGNSLTAAAQWLNQHAPAGSRVWLTFPGEHFFKIDRGRLNFVRGIESRPNYKVSLIRGLERDRDTDDDYLHPRRKPVFAVTVEGVNLVEIFEYPEFRDLADGSELQPEAAGAAARPGLVVQEYSDAAFTSPEGQPSIAPALAFDCRDNPYSDRAVSVRYSGALLVPRSGAYTFEVTSDDLAVLYLDGRAALTNASGTASRRWLRLGAGEHALRLDYRNDVGPACLTVRWGPRGAKVLELLGGASLSH